jgi:hypothetical protein
MSSDYELAREYASVFAKSLTEEFMKQCKEQSIELPEDFAENLTESLTDAYLRGEFGAPSIEEMARRAKAARPVG